MSVRETFDVLRPGEVRDVNAAAVLRCLLASGPESRVRIAEELGLTQGAVTRITALLAERGLVTELEPLHPTGRGRPRIPIAIVADAFQAIGVHIGVEHIAIGLANLDGSPIQALRIDFDGTVRAATEAIAEATSRLAAAASAPVLGLGVITGGWVEPETGTVRAHRALDWTDVPLRDLLASATNLPTVVDSSVRAHATADIMFGAARGYRNFIHVFVGNIVEVAVVVDGKVRSAPDGYGGSISDWPMDDGRGHTRTTREVITDPPVLAAARARGVVSDNDGLDELLARARESDTGATIARELLLTRARRTGELIAQINTLLAPQLIVVSSGVLYLDGTMAALEAGLDSSPLTVRRPPIRSGNTRGNALITSASAIAIERLLLNAGDLEAPVARSQ